MLGRQINTDRNSIPLGYLFSVYDQGSERVDCQQYIPNVGIDLSLGVSTF